MKKWKTLDSKMAFDHRWMKVRQDTVERGDGVVLDDYFVWLEGDVVLTVPVTKDGRFVMVRQYKHAVGEIMIEFPAGMVDHNEDSKKAAMRELVEETGYISDNLQLIGTVVNNPTKAVGKIYIYLAENVEQSMEQKLDENEEIEVLALTIEELRAGINSGEIWVTGTITGALLAMTKLGVLNFE